MPTSATTSEFYQGSDSNAFIPPLHKFSQSGSDAEPSIAFAMGMPETFGASALAAARSRKTLKILQDFLAGEFFRRYPSIVETFSKKWLIVDTPSTEITSAIHALADADAVSSFRQAEGRIRSFLESEPVEDGFVHPAELHLDAIIRTQGGRARDWLFDLVCGGRWNLSLAAGLLRLLSRHKPLTDSWRLQVVQSALSSSDVGLRDAAVQAAEAWEDPPNIKILQRHKEPCAWLADYITNVIRDLTE